MVAFIAFRHYKASDPHQDYCRYPQYNAVRFTFTVLFGLLLATTFWRVGMHR